MHCQHFWQHAGTYACCRAAYGVCQAAYPAAMCLPMFPVLSDSDDKSYSSQQPIYQ